MKRKHFIIALMAMLSCFAFTAKAQTSVSSLDALKAALASTTNILVDGEIVVDEAITIPAGTTVGGNGTLLVRTMVYVVSTENPYPGVSYNKTATKNGSISGTVGCNVAYEISLDGGETWFDDTTNGKAQAVTVKEDGTKSISTSFQSAFTSAKSGEIVHMLKDAHVQSTNSKKNNGPLRSYYGLILEGNGHTIYTDLESSGASNEYATIKFTSYLAGTGADVRPVLKNVTINSQNNSKADLDLVSGDVTFTVSLYNVNLLGKCQYASFPMTSPSTIINKSNVKLYDSKIPSWDAGSAKLIEFYSGEYSLSLNPKCKVYGGTFSKAPSSYLADCAQVKQENGKYVVSYKAAEVKVEVTPSEEFTSSATEEEKAVANELAANTAVSNETLTLPVGVSNFTVQLTDIEATAEATTKVTFNVEPKNASGAKVSNPSEAITFRLPVPAAWSGKANVYHGSDLLGAYTIEEESGAKFVEVSSANFSEFAVEAIFAAKVGETPYATFAEAAAAAQAGSEIKLLANIEGDITVPANVTLNGNGFTISGGIFAEGDITFAGVTTAADFDAKVVNTAVNIPAGASLQLTGSARLVIGHGATFNITGTIENAKTADKATLVPSLKIAAGASITGNGVTFNVNNAYIESNANTTSKNSNANGTLDFNINNSIWEQTGVLAFYVPTSGKDPVVNFDLKNSVLTTTSHLVFSVTKGEVVIDNSNVNVGKSNQIENRSTMTIKNGSVVNGAVATSSNAINPGTIIVENATYAVTGEFSGAAEGTGTLVIKKGANVSVGSIKAGANVTVDAEGMAAGDGINFTANLSQFTGVLSVINNDKLEAQIVNGKVVLAAKPVAKIGETPYTTLEAAFAAATEGQTITMLDDATPALTSQRAITKAAVIDLGAKTMTLTEDDLYFGTTTFKNGTIVVDPSVKPSTAVFWMFANQTLTFDNVKIVATGVTGTYLIGLEGENSDLNLLNGSEILVENTTALDLDIICVNGTNTCDIKVENSKVNVKNLDGRVFFRGNYTVKDSEVNLAGITKAGFRIEAGQTLSIEGTSKVNIEGEPRDGGIHMTDASANYKKAETATVNATVNEPKVAKIGETTYKTLQAAIDAVKEGETVTLVDDVNVTTPAYGQNALNHAKAVSFTLDLNGKTLSANTGNSVFRFNIANSGATSNVTLTIKNGKIVAGSNTWCAVMASGISADVKAIMNLENLTIEASKAGDLAVKAWDNATINANNVTVNATNAAGGFYAVGGEIVLDECTVNQKGLHTAPYLSMAFAVSTNGKMTVNSGTYSAEPTAAAEGYNQGSTHGSWVGGVMNSGGELIINGGTFSNGNFGDDALATAARGLIFADSKGKVTVNGGTFNALKSIFDFQNNLGTTSPVITVKGGNYSADPAVVTSYGSIVLDANCVAVENNGVWNVVKAAAKVGDKAYASLEEAFKAATADCTIDILSDVTVDYAWDARYTGGKFTVPVTINGNGKTIKFTASVNDNNYQAPFRFEADATVKNLTIDMSEVTDNRFRAISSKGNLTVDGCKFIGKDETLNCRAIIFGEGAGANVGNLAISITNSEFINWKRGITDNENAQDVKTVTITGNTLTDAGVGVSAKETVTFTGNTVSGAYVNIKSYTAGNKLAVTATGNTLEDNTDAAYNVIDAGGVVNAEGFNVVAKGNNFNGYTSTEGIWGEVWGNARESFVIKVLDANGNVMGTSSLNNIDGIIDGDVTVTWSILFNAPAPNPAAYWSMEWTTAPTLNNMPAKVELWVDGTRVSGGPVVLNGPDDLNKINVIVTDAEGKVTSCQTTVANALAAAKDGETVNLLWKEGAAPLAMNGSVFGKNVTIKGTAKVDWNKGWLFVGRGGEGNATVTFDGANLTSASNSTSTGIHVSGRENNTTNKYDGTLVIKNSTIELDYLINRNAIELDNATLTVKNGFGIAGRPASETESGANATATISLKNNSKVVVNNHNGMGLGQAAKVLEGLGVMNIDATSAFETPQGFVVTANGTMNIAGKATVAGTLTNNGAIVLTDAAATLTSSECGNVTTSVQNSVVSYIDGKYTVGAAAAKFGDKYFATLAEAIAASTPETGWGGEVTLLQDVTLEGGYADAAEGLRIEKSVTINGGGHTIDCGTFTKGIRIYQNADKASNVMFKNINIVNNNAKGRCIDTRSAKINLMLNGGVNLTAHGTNSQPLTIGGSEAMTKVTISGGTIDAGTSGYAVICFVPVTGHINVQSNAVIKGLAAFYLKEGVKNTSIKLSQSTSIGTNKYAAASGDFGAIVIEGSNNTVRLEHNDAVVKAVAADGAEMAAQAAILVRGEGNTINILAENAQVITEGKNAYRAIVNTDVAASAKMIEAGNELKLVAENRGYQFYSFEEAVRFAGNEGTIKVVNDFELAEAWTVAAGQNITLDLNGKTVSYTSAVAGEDMITNRGNLTITDSSDAKTGKLTYVNTDATASNVTVSTISSEPGSVLNITGGTVENKTVKTDGSSIYSFAIDMLTNGNLGDVTATIAGGTVYSDYMAIRQFNNGTACKNTLNINGGYIYGAKRAVQVHLNNNAAYTTIIGGKVEAGADGYAICNFAATGNLEVTGGEFIGAVYSARENFISGGTYNSPVEAAYCAEGYMPNKNANGTYGVVAVVDAVAIIDGFAYSTFADAIKACVAGDNTITLLADCAEEVTITQVNGTNITINGNGKTYTGTITIKGDKVANNLSNTETLTFQNINFAPAYSSYAITAEKNTYARNITVVGCTFKGNNDVYGIRVRNGYNYTVKNTTVEGVYTFFNASEALNGLTVENVTVKCANVAFSGAYGYGNASFKNVTVESGNNGIKVNNPNSSALTFENCSITAKAPVTFYENAGVTSALTAEFNGTNTMVVSEGGTYWFNIVEADATDATFKAIVNDADLDMSNTAFAASVGNVYYSSLQKAIDAAVDGDVVTLAKNIELDAANCVTNSDGYSVFVNIAGKAITIDLNGKAVTANLSADQFASAKSSLLMAVLSVDTNGNLTLNDSKGTGKVAVTANDASVYSLISNYDSSAKLTINGGSYELDNARAKSSLIHSDPSEAVVVNGGNFYLGNVNTGANGSPWIFNVNGNNTGHVIVNGGTYNFDVAHQYYEFEVSIDKTFAMKNNGNGTWTVVPAAVYVAEESTSSLGYTNYVGYVSVADALAHAKEVGMTDLEITIIGTNDASTTDNFDLVYTTLFENVTIKQDNGGAPYYFYDIYTGIRANDGKFLFDGVNIVVTDQYMFEGNVELTNNSVVKSVAAANCFVYYANVTVEAGSKIDGVIEDIRGGSLIIDGGKTDGTYSEVPGLSDAILVVNWTDSKLVLQNGAYVKINSANEVGQLTVNGTLDVLDSKLDSYQWITVNSDAVMNLNIGSIVTTKAINGAGKITVDATNVTSEPVTVISGDMTGFTGTIELTGNEYAIYEKTNEGLVIKSTYVDEVTFVDGEFTEYVNDKDIEVGKLTYKRANMPNAWQAFYVPFEVPVSVLAEQGFDVAYINGVRRDDKDKDGNLDEFVMEVIYLHYVNDNNETQVDGSSKTLKANYPYFVRANKNNDDNVLDIELSGVKLYAAKDVTYDCTTMTEKYEITGNSSSVFINSSEDVLKYGVSTKGGWTKITKGATVKPFRFYMTLTSRDGSAPVMSEAASEGRIVVRGEELENGETIIYDVVGNEQKSEAIFDLQGRRVQKPVKGNLYIINGKKVVY